MYVWIDWNFTRNLKLFALFKNLIRKTISNLPVFLEELFWENRILKILDFLLPKPMQTHLQRKYLQKALYQINFNAKSMSE
jgi:hypothetical protein